MPRDVPRPKPEGPQAPKGFGRGSSRGTPFSMITPRVLHIMSIFRLFILVKRDFFHWRQTQPVPRESIGHYSGLGQGMLLEINPNILVRDEERMPNRPSIREGSTAVVLMVTHRETASCVTKICEVSRKNHTYFFISRIENIS